MALRDFIQKGEEYFAEARDKAVSTEFRIALGKLKGIYGNDEIPTTKVFNKDVDMIIKKYSLDSSFKEYAKNNIQVNESEDQELDDENKLGNEQNESAVGEVGRTSKEDAEAHITPELKAEFEKLIKQIGGKAVARALLDGNTENGEISESTDYSDFLSEKEVGYLVYNFTDEEDFKRVQKKFFEKGLVWGRDGSKDIKDVKVLKQLDIRSFDDLGLYNEGKDMYLGNKTTLYKRKDLKKIESSDIK